MAALGADYVRPRSGSPESS